MDFIDFIKDKKYVCYNVNEKQPILGNVKDPGYIGWSKITYEQALKHHQPNIENWGMRTGQQENGDYILGLDFDMWYKEKSTNKYIQSENTRKLFDEFLILNEEKKGVFSSSTELNRGCMCDVTDSKKILEILSINGSKKIQKTDYCLEILNGFNMVLPPTKTKCKIREQAIDKRTFLSDIHILKIDENSELEDFIFNYLNDATTKKNLTKTQLKTKDNKIAYQKYVDKEFDFTDDKELFRPFLDLLDNERRENYNEWYKIGYSIKNLFGNDGWDLF